MVPLAALAVLLGHAPAALGQPGRPAAVLPPAAAPPAMPPVSAPQRTTATFADWTLRCERPAGVVEVCEVVQVILAEGRQVAQIAVGRTGRGEPMHLTVLVPPSASFAQPVRLGGPGKDGPAVDLPWRRCLPGGCLAETVLPDDLLRQLRTRADPSRVAFLDGAGKEAAIPFSPRGLAQALDALAREEAS